MNAPRSWYYAEGEETFGPVPASEIAALIQQAVILPSTWILAEGTEHWMLAQDSPFSDGLQNAYPEPADQPEAVHGAEVGLIPMPSVTAKNHYQFLELFATKGRKIGGAIFSHTKRRVRLACLKAQIEKWTRFNLTKAYYHLGKRGYELKVVSEHFGSRYDEIASLEQSIVTKAASTGEQSHLTVLTKVRKAATNTKIAAEAQALALRLKMRLTAFGEEYSLHSTSESTAPVQTELQAVESAKARIAALKVSYALAAADQRPIPKATGILFGGVFEKWMVTLRSRRAWQLVIVASLLCFVAVWTTSLLRYLNRRESLPSPWHLPSPSSKLASGVEPSTPLPRLTPDGLKSQYASMIATQEQRQLLFVWEKAMNLAPNTSTLTQSKLWTNYQNTLTYYELLLRDSSIVVLQQLGPQMYEARFEHESSAQDTFVLLTNSTSFQSTGRASLSIVFVETRSVKLNNGFDRQTAVFREVIQEQPQEVKARLESAALSFSTSIRSAPPDDATLEDYISEIGTYRAKRDQNTLLELKGQRERHYQAMRTEENVLYVCLQARLRKDFKPIGPTEVAATGTLPSASATSVPSGPSRPR